MAPRPCGRKHARARAHCVAPRNRMKKKKETRRTAQPEPARQSPTRAALRHCCHSVPFRSTPFPSPPRRAAAGTVRSRSSPSASLCRCVCSACRCAAVPLRLTEVSAAARLVASGALESTRPNSSRPASVARLRPGPTDSFSRSVTNHRNRTPAPHCATALRSVTALRHCTPLLRCTALRCRFYFLPLLPSLPPSPGLR